MTDHDLNKLLADVAGIQVVEDEEYGFWSTTCEGEIGSEWTPLTDHNQMALVKVWLRKEGYYHRWEWFAEKYFVIIGKYNAVGEYQRWQHNSPDELRAFAETVAKMKEGKG